MEWLRDSLIGFLLFLVAGFLSGVAQDLVPFDYPDLYLLWFLIALIPFFMFARSRGIGHELRFGDAIIFVPMILVAAFWPRSAVAEPELLFVLAMVASLYAGQSLRLWCKRCTHGG
jgi:hypothetical protein